MGLNLRLGKYEKNKKIMPMFNTIISRSRDWVLRNPIFSIFLLPHLLLTVPPLTAFLALAIVTLISSLVVCLLTGLVLALLFTACCIGIALLVLVPTLLFTTACAVTLSIWVYGAYFAWVWFSEGNPGQKQNLVGNLRQQQPRQTDKESNVPVGTLALPQWDATGRVPASIGKGRLQQDDPSRDSSSVNLRDTSSPNQGTDPRSSSHIDTPSSVGTLKISSPETARLQIAPQSGAGKFVFGSIPGTTGDISTSEAAPSTIAVGSTIPLGSADLVSSPRSLPLDMSIPGQSPQPQPFTGIVSISNSSPFTIPSGNATRSAPSPFAAASSIAAPKAAIRSIASVG